MGKPIVEPRARSPPGQEEKERGEEVACPARQPTAPRESTRDIVLDGHSTQPGTPELFASAGPPVLQRWERVLSARQSQQPLRQHL